MTDIQRYEPEGMLDAGYSAYAEMEEHPTGDYVLFSDHQARIETLTKQLDSTLKDRALIMQERDKTFALMLARVEAAEAKLAHAVQQLLECEEEVSQTVERP